MPQLYETQYGIFDHTQPLKHKPMSAIEFNPAYDSFKVSPLIDIIARYEENSISDVLHMTFLEYINLPRHITQLLDEQARAIRKTRDQRLGEINKSLGLGGK